MSELVVNMKGLRQDVSGDRQLHPAVATSGVGPFEPRIHRGE